MDRKIRYFVNGWSFRLSFATRPGYDGFLDYKEDRYTTVYGYMD